MARDLIDDRFGRFREIPLALARRGHDLAGICLSYGFRREGDTVDEDAEGGAGVRWHSVNAGKVKVSGLAKFVHAVRRAVQESRPDVIWACSDSFYGVIADHVSRNTDTRFFFDLYDNFESYGSTKIPGVLPLYRQAVVRADGVTCVSRPLAELVKKRYRREKPTMVLENAIADGIFYPRDKRECREQLGLPVDARIIGTAGALDPSRGIEILFEGFARLAAGDRNIHLAIAGPRKLQSIIPAGPGVHDFGILPLERVAVLLNALDVAVICNRNSAFGRFCFPQKAYEIVACRVPVVAASVGAMRDLLENVGNSLFEAENPDDLVRAVTAQLKQPEIAAFDPPSWDHMAVKLEAFLDSDSR